MKRRDADGTKCGQIGTRSVNRPAYGGNESAGTPVRLRIVAAHIGRCGTDELDPGTNGGTVPQDSIVRQLAEPSRGHQPRTGPRLDEPLARRVRTVGVVG